jgi:hypothetical protein
MALGVIGAVAAFALFIGFVFGFLLGKRASTWCERCGGIVASHPQVEPAQGLAEAAGRRGHPR